MFSFALFSNSSRISVISFLPCLKFSTVRLRESFPAEMYVVFRFSFFRSNIFLILVIPSLSKHLITMLCLSCSFFRFLFMIFSIAISDSFGMYFFRRVSSAFAATVNSLRVSKSFRIFSLTSDSFSFKICLNATSIAWDCLNFCITSFFSFEVTLLRLRWTLLPSTFRILQTTCLFGTTYCRISLIRPAAISEDTIVPSSPFGILTNVIVLVTFSTLQSIRSPSFILILRNLFI